MIEEQFSGPWLPWYHADFLHATLGWTVTERGVYFLLLGASWEMGPLPEERRRLAGIVGAQLDEFDEAWKTVSTKFQKTKKGLINRRLELHREKQALRSQKASQSAKNRWAKPGDSNANAHASVDTNAHASGDANAYASHEATGDANPMLSGMRNGCLADAPQISDLKSEKNSEPKAQNKERSHRASRNAPTRIPDDFALTDERRKFATDRGLDAVRVFEMFTTYWRAKGSNATKADWTATWQHWCAKDASDRAERSRPRKTTFEETQAHLDAMIDAASDDDDASTSRSGPK